VGDSSPAVQHTGSSEHVRTRANRADTAAPYCVPLDPPEKIRAELTALGTFPTGHEQRVQAAFQTTIVRGRPEPQSTTGMCATGVNDTQPVPAGESESTDAAEDLKWTNEIERLNGRDRHKDHMRRS
jgi:hypothetical protein